MIQAVDNRGNVTFLEYSASNLLPDLPTSGVPLNVPLPIDVPICHAGDDQVLACDPNGVSVGLGPATPDPNAVSYEWTSNCSAVFSDPDIHNPTATLPTDCGDSCEITMTVTYENGQICTDIVTITVVDDEAPGPDDSRRGRGGVRRQHGPTSHRHGDGL